MKILDTHVWVWWESRNSRLTGPQREAIENEYRTGSLGISAVSCWEIAMLVSKGRLNLNMDGLSWFRVALSRPSVELLPLTSEIAVRAYQLPEPFHPDPADRLIGATEVEIDRALVTSVTRILEHPSVATVY